MLAEYLQEKDGAKVIEVEGGFLAYHALGEQFYISDFFIKKEFRQSAKNFSALTREAYDMAVKIGCKRFTCHVPVSIQDVSGVLLSRLKAGFKVIGLEGDKICLSMKLEECSWARP